MYLSAFICFNAVDAYDELNEQRRTNKYLNLFIVTTVVPLIMLFIWSAFLPSTMTVWTVITNIEMMKDRSLID